MQKGRAPTDAIVLAYNAGHDESCVQDASQAFSALLSQLTPVRPRSQSQLFALDIIARCANGNSRSIDKAAAHFIVKILDEKFETHFMTRFFGLVRFIAILGVAASALLSAGLYLTSAVRAVLLVMASLNDLGRETTGKALLIAAIELADALLVATGLLIVAIGLYSLFIDRVDKLPAWLHIDNFDALKNKLVSVVVAALAVRFFSIVMEGAAEVDAALYAAAIAAVLLGLAAYSFASAWTGRLEAQCRTKPCHKGGHIEPPHTNPRPAGTYPSDAEG